MKEGRQVGRAELYIVTHTKRNGEPVDKYSGDNINEIRKQFAANPSLVGEEARDGDVFSGLFPKERSGRWRGLGLLVGGAASKQLAEVKAELQETKSELQETKSENKRLWSVVQSLEKNQSELQQQHNELKAMLLASQGREPGDSNHKIVQEQPKVPSEDMAAMDNQDKETLTSSRGNKGSKVKTEISKKPHTSLQMEKTPALQQQGMAIVSEKRLHKKPKKFESPLQKGAATILKRGLEVGLISPQSTSMVAFATIQATDSKSKATDGQPLQDCVEVLINTVFSKTTLLPRSQGNISKLTSAIGRCVPWPRKNLEPLHDGCEPLHDGCGGKRTSKLQDSKVAGTQSVNGIDKQSSGKRSAQLEGRGRVGTGGKKVKSSNPICSPRQSL